MQKINRKDLVEVVAEEGHLSKKDSRVAIDLVFGLIEKAILAGQEVNVTNFGVFTPKTKQGRDEKIYCCFVYDVCGNGGAGGVHVRSNRCCG